VNAGRYRVAIVGSPRAGKTSLALCMGKLLHLPVLSSDEFIDLGWSAASEEVARRILTAPGVYEGVAVVRALRKLMIANDNKPVDYCIVMSKPHLELSAGQERMRRGCETIFDGIRLELIRRGVDIATGAP
jgi:hypothetical protein